MSDLPCDVMGIEVEAANVLMNAGEGAEALDCALSLLQHLALQALRPPRCVLNAGCLHPQHTGFTPENAFQRQNPRGRAACRPVAMG